MRYEKNNFVNVEDLEFGPFENLVERINDESSLKEINDVQEEINERFFKWFDLEYEKLGVNDYWKLNSYEFLFKMREQHKHAIATIYSKKGAIIID